MILQNFIGRAKFIEYIWNTLEKIDQTSHNRYLLNLCYEFFVLSEVNIISSTEFEIKGLTYTVESGEVKEEIAKHFWYEYRH